MSYIVLSDRVKETSYTIGTGSFELEGAVQGFASFASAYADGDNLFYAITDGTRYEVGSGLYFANVTDGTGLARFPINSSNSNSLVNFPIGLKEVFVTYPGSHSVYHASGYASSEAPTGSGIAFWLSNNVIGYDSSFVWDNTNSRIGINTASPSYAIDLGGYGPDAIIRASGLIAGTSGVYFPEANNGDSEYLGGRQVVHFDPNDVLDVDTQTVIGVSGQVNQYIYLHEQPKGFVLAGPPSGCAGDCSPAVPQFRPLSLEDIPNLSSLYELAGTSGILRNALVDVSGIIISSGTQFISDLEAASGSLFSDIEGVSGDLLMVSGAMVVVSGMAEFDLAVSGILNNRLEEVSGIIISSGTQFISDLEAASGTLFNDILGVSGDLNTVSGIAIEALTSGVYAVENLGTGGITLNDSMTATSGIVIASGTQFILDLEAASGTLFSDILGVSGDLNTVSGIAIEALTSGVYAIMNAGTGGITLNDSMTATSGIVIASGTQFLNDLRAASGVSSKLLVDLTGTENTAVIKNDDLGEATHFRLNNSGGVGSRLLLSSSSGVDGNTWANVSLNDGAYRVYNYTYDWDINVSGVLSGSNQIILESGRAWRDLLPINLVGTSVSGLFLNNGHPSGVLVDSQYPPSGHILTISAHPGQSLITNPSTSVPAPVNIFSLGVNSIVATKDNKFGLNLDPQAITSDLDIRGESIRIRNSGVITSPSDDGYKGEIKWDENYIYVCVANNTWKRTAIETWTPTTTSTLPP